MVEFFVNMRHFHFHLNPSFAKNISYAAYGERLLRVCLAIAQIAGMLGVTAIGVTQPDLLAPLMGHVQTAQAATGDITGVVFISSLV